LPSKSTIASEGAAVPIPGVTIGGRGSHTSVASGLVKSFLKTVWFCAPAEKKGKAKKSSSMTFHLSKNIFRKVVYKTNHITEDKKKKAKEMKY
jgi:Zn-dependent M28 family amino/carboxypeptidase